MRDSTMTGKHSVVLDAGPGAVERFVAAWNAWRVDSAARGRLHFIAIEPRPLEAQEVRKFGAGSPRETLAATLADDWPPMTSNFHRLGFEGGQVQLLMAFGDISAVLPELVCTVDAFRLRNPNAILGTAASADHDRRYLGRVLKAMARIAAANATLLVDDDSPDLLRAVSAAGFKAVASEPSTTLARFEPGFVPRRAPTRSPSPSFTDQHALVIGAGLAGCAVAWALAEQGWRSTVVDRNASPAEEASGNPAGLFHGIVNPQDGAHARFNRAAALEARRLVSRATEEWGIAGAVRGLLRLDDAPGGIGAMRDVLASSKLPPSYVLALDAAQAGELAGVPLDHPAWFYPGGGWVNPAQLAAAMLESTDGKATFVGDLDVRSLQRIDNEWKAFDVNGRCVAKASVVVLANAGAATRLLGSSAWPLEPVRGQLSIARASALGCTLPQIPVAGAGYLLPEIGHQAIFGATAHPGESDTTLRAADHTYNLAQLRRLTGREAGIPIEALQGRVGVRWSTDDRLPIIGAVPDIETARTASRLDQPRFVPRLAGAYVFTGLGSRGITWCALGAQVLASAITGAPSPLEASLLDAVDAGRFVSRQARRASQP